MDIYDFLFIIILIGFLIFIFYGITKLLYYIIREKLKKDFYFQYKVLSIQQLSINSYAVIYKDDYGEIHATRILMDYSDSKQEHNVFMGEENVLIIKRVKGRLYKHLILTKEYY